LSGEHKHTGKESSIHKSEQTSEISFGEPGWRPLKPNPRLESVTSLNRRRFISGGAAVATAALASAASANTPGSWLEPGEGFSNYGKPRADRSSSIRWISENPSVPGDGVSWTPLHEMEGSITPNGLHFERHHNGVPQIDPAAWELTIHGLVKRPLAYSLEALHRSEQHSRISFIECGGNSNALWAAQPVQTAAGYMHGLVSCAEWTGVYLRQLLDEAGLRDKASWLVVDGLDSAGVSVSLPLNKLPADTLVALYQNGEALRSANGYPARLVVPGWEGIANIKWLRSIQVTDKPLYSKFDTVSYTDLGADGIAERFTFEMGVKSVITSPSPGQQLQEPGWYEIRGLAWTGAGSITQVDVSTDNQNWHQAVLQEPVLDKALTRFRIPWEWDGKPATLLSVATDQTGARQPTRSDLLARKGSNVYYHFNAINSWSVDQDGSVRHVYV